MLDDPRGGLDASSLHLATSMYNYKVEKFGLLSYHRDTLKNIYDINNKNTFVCFEYIYTTKARTFSSLAM